jgi:hypothetical protein
MQAAAPAVEGVMTHQALFLRFWYLLHVLLVQHALQICYSRCIIETRHKVRPLQRLDSELHQSDL